MYPLMTTLIVCTLFGIGVEVLAMVLAKWKALGAADIATELFYFFVAVYAAVFPWICAYGHPDLRRQAGRYFFCRSSVVVRPGQEAAPKNANGIALILDRSTEQELHFRALDSAWK